MINWLHSLCIVCLLLLPACETVKDMNPFSKSEAEIEEELANEQDLSDQELYDLGKARLDEGRYQSAIEQFEEIERLYPFSPLAAKAQIMVAYSQYKDEEYDDAILTIDDFIRLHPGNKEIGYMYYLKALSFYDRIADVKRDQGITQQALAALKEVQRRFPDSGYARDAKLKTDLVKDHLAGKEMTIGRFYLKDRKFIAAINRFRKVVDEFQNTSHVEEALYRLVESYLSLGLMQEAKKNAAVLGHNYPSSKWYKYAYRLVEEGENSPVALTEKSWFQDWLTTGNDPEPLPKDDKADSWFNSILDAF